MKRADAIKHARNLERERDEAREANTTIQSREAKLVLSKERISKRAEAIRCELVEKEKQLAESQAYANKCREGCIALSHSIDRIDYLCGEPNEMGVSDYCVHQNDEAVVERVKAKLTELEAMREAIKEATHHLQYIANANVASLSAKGAARHALSKLQPFIKP